MKSLSRALAMASVVLGLSLLSANVVVLAAPESPQGVERQGNPEEMKEVSIAGTVVDDKGNPVEGVEVSPIWSKSDEALTCGSRGMYKTKTDAKGAYSMKLPERALKQQTIPMLAYSADGKKVGIAVCSKSSAPKDVSDQKITLAEGIELIASVKNGDKEAEGAVAVVSTIIDNAKMNLCQVITKGSKISMVLPKGDYELAFYHPTDRSWSSKKVTAKLPNGDKKGDIGEVTLVKRGTVFVDGKGKPAPELGVTHVRNTKNKKLADFKGKWILLDFWGVW